MSLRRHLSLLLCASFLLVALAGCRGSGPKAELTGRLWVSDLPTNPRERMTAFAIVDLKARKMGAFHRGSMYSGRHDLFRWIPGSGNKGTILMLQNDQQIEISVEDCTPDRGFDHCVLLKGDPLGTERYQSRKRWTIPRRGEAIEPTALSELLAEEDPDLQALVAAED